MARALLLALLLLTLPASGCLEGGLGGPFGGQGPVEARDVFDQIHPFSYANILDPERPPLGTGDLYQRGSDTFQVPRDTRTLEVRYQVLFQNASGQGPPEGGQEVRLALQGPSDREQASIELVTSQEGTWTFQRPNPGPWTYAFEARGEGELSIQATVFVPAS